MSQPNLPDSGRNLRNSERAALLDRRLTQPPLQLKAPASAHRPPRLKVFQRYDLPLFFVTFCTHKRKLLLANQTVHDIFIAYCERGSLRGAGVGRYVLMPDHMHLFVRLSPDLSLPQWVRNLKRSISTRIVEHLRIGRKDFSITYCGAKRAIRKNGHT